MPLYLGKTLVGGTSRPVDAEPIEGSKNLISSGGVKSYIDGQIGTHNQDTAAHPDIRQTIDALNTTAANKANNDLSNVTNDVFKAKVEASGFSGGGGGGVIVSATQPASDKQSCLWIDTSDNSVAKYYNGSAWTPLVVSWS